MGLTNLFKKKGDSEKPSGQDIESLKQRFSQVSQNSQAQESSQDQSNSENSQPSVQNPSSSGDVAQEKPLARDSAPGNVNVVEVQGDKETSTSVSLGNEEDKKFEEVILSQDTSQKEKEKEIDKKSIASYLEEIKENYEDAKLISLVIKQVKELIEIDNNLNKKIEELEKSIKKETSEREKQGKRIDEVEKQIKGIDKKMDKFVGIYELVTNQFNPFLEKSTQPGQVSSNPSGQDSTQGAPNVSPSQGSQSPSAQQPVASSALDITKETDDDEEEENQEDDSTSSAQALFRKLKAKKEKDKPAEHQRDFQGSGTQPAQPAEAQNPQSGQQEPSSAQVQDPVAVKQGPPAGQAQIPSEGQTQGGGQAQVTPSQDASGTHASQNIQPESAQNAQAEQSPQSQVNAGNQLLSNEQQSTGASAGPAQQGNVPETTQPASGQGTVSQAIPKKTKVLPEHLHFVLKDGQRIDSLSGLLRFLQDSDEKTISDYVTHYKNEFAGWIYETYHNEALSKQLAACNSKDELTRTLSNYIINNH